MKNSYIHIAPWYDELMSHVPYLQWSQYIHRIFKAFRFQPDKILELGCGTCRLANLMNEKLPASLTVYSDLSFAMLSKYQGKEPINRMAIDMKHLPFKTGFHFIYLLYDAFNYLTSVKEVRQLFREVRRTLLPGGYFLFDITTEHNSKTYFLDYAEVGIFQGIEIARRSYYDIKKKIQHNVFNFYFPQTGKNHFDKVTESHMQRIYSPEEIINLLADCRLNICGIYAGFSFQKPGPASERIHFLVQRP